MPFVKISALPNKFDVGKIMKEMEEKFYDATVVPEGKATFLWQTLDCITHNGDSQYEFDPKKDEFPIFVDLYVDSVFNYREISEMMESITSELNSQTQIDRKWVFIFTHIGNPGHVYVMDKVWPCKMEHPGT